MASNMSSSSKKRKKGQYCCVVGCHRETLRDKDEVSFFRFPSKVGKCSNPEKRELWIKAVNRMNDDGSHWEPKEWTRICSDHFVGDWHRQERSHPDYKPSIFPTSHIKPSSEVDIQRHDRARKRILRAALVPGPPARIAKRDEESNFDIKVSTLPLLSSSSSTEDKPQDRFAMTNKAESLLKMSKKLVSHKTPKYKGAYCCVIGCHRSTVRDKGKVSFFNFPTKNQEKRQLWIRAVNRSNWEPKKWTKICSDHFVGGRHREERDHPDYKPSIFPNSHIQPKSDPLGGIEGPDEYQEKVRVQDHVNVGTQAELDYDYKGFEFSCEHEIISESKSAHAATFVSLAYKTSKENTCQTFEGNVKRPMQVFWQWQ